MYKSDLVIIGAGAAGLSAALYGVRAGLSVSVIYLDSGALGRAHLIENYFGFAEPVSGQALLDATTANLRRLGCRFKSGEVVAVNMTDNGFSVTLADGALETGTAVLIATGRPVSLPPIPGIGAFEGNELCYDWRIASERQKTEDEIGLTILHFLDQVGIKVSDIEGIVIGSVVPVLTEALFYMSRKYFSIKPVTFLAPL